MGTKTLSKQRILIKERLERNDLDCMEVGAIMKMIEIQDKEFIKELKEAFQPRNFNKSIFTSDDIIVEIDKLAGDK